MTEGYPRPGWGIRHPDLTELLAVTEPAAVMEQTWGLGQPIRLAAYTEPADLPDEITTSVRCIVRVGDQIVVCSNRDGFSHVWPGGRREPGESHPETACREVMEETGWTLDPKTLELLGWLHMENLEPQPEDHPFPHPDFLQHVYTAKADEGPGGRSPDWIDTEGYELSSCLMTIEDAMEKVSDDPLALAFLRLLRPVLPAYAGRDCRYQAAIVDGGKVLMLKVRDPYTRRGFWLVPGGGREGTEGEEECIRREVREETDLDVEVVRLLWEEPVVGDRTYQRVKTYLCRSTGGVARAGREPEEGEHEHHIIEDLAWFPVDEPDLWGPGIDGDALTHRFLTKLREVLRG